MKFVYSIFLIVISEDRKGTRKRKSSKSGGQAKEHKDQLERLKEKVSKSTSLYSSSLLDVSIKLVWALRVFESFVIVLQDPAFYEYLRERDQELLHFNDEDIDVSL